MNRELKILRHGGLNSYGKSGFFIVIGVGAAAFLFGTFSEGGKFYCRLVSKSQLAKWKLI